MLGFRNAPKDVADLYREIPKLMPRKLSLTAAAFGAACVAAIGVASATEVEPKLDDKVSLRKEMMHLTGASMGVMARIAKGEAEFDAGAVLGALRTMHAVSLGFADQFPEGSETAESEAGPKIWSDAAGFEAAVAKFIADTGAAVKLAPADAEGMKQAMGMVGANCKACHTDYRVKKD